MSSATLAFITDFADQAVILPVSAAVLLVLALQRRWTVAAAWGLAIGSVLGTILVLKVACYACGWLVPAFAPDRLALLTPSGHAGSSSVVYGALAALAAPRHKPVAAFAAALACAVLVGFTRVQLGAHSPAEVVVASLVGIAGAIGFGVASSRLAPHRPALPALGAVALIWLGFHGLHLPAEQVIQSSAARLVRLWVTACRPS